MHLADLGELEAAAHAEAEEDAHGLLLALVGLGGLVGLLVGLGVVVGVLFFEVNLGNELCGNEIQEINLIQSNLTA